MIIDKYQSCENTFLITFFKKQVDYSLLAQELCLKHNSDGLLIFKNDPMQMIVYNKDGSEADMCGNGIRCLTHFLYNKFNIYNYLEIKTKSGSYECEVISNNPFISSVRLGIGEYVDDILKEKIIINEKEFVVSALRIGVLHLIVLSDDFTEDSNYVIDIYNHPKFNKQFNISLVKPISSNVFEFLTYERGVGFTKSCGTAAAACGYILNTEYNLESNLTAISPGGILKIDIEDEIILQGESYFMERVMDDNL